MKAIQLLLLCCFVSVLSIFGQETPKTPPSDQAEIQFESDFYDFGTLKQGAECFTVFTFKNTGKAPLVISKAQASCGCTVPETPKDAIPPGKTGQIKVKYDSNRTGPFEKTITVFSNAVSQQKVLRIKGRIEPKPVEETFPTNGIHKNGTPFE